MRTVNIALALAAFGLLAVAFCGCASSTPATDADRARAAVYAIELQACVETATTLAESRFCRCSVSKRYGRPCDE